MVWKISKSPMVEKIYCAPGNAGTQELAESVPINAEDIDQLAAFARENEIDLTVVGPEGPNTGGMGAYSPAPVLDHMLREKAMKEVMIPAIQGMAKEGTPFKGVLYAGLMVDKDQIKVLEFNTRLGDPETQPILMRLENDLVPLMEACCNGTLHNHSTKIDPRAAMCVVISSGGYPGAYDTGEEISGLDEANRVDDAVVFHVGTALKEGKVVTIGGRVLGVTALGDTVKKAASFA